MALTKAEALALLGREIPAAQAPALDSADLDDLVALMAVRDAAGNAPRDAAWAETYDRGLLAYAAMRAWERKAARVAGLVTFTADGASINAGELHLQCLRMAKRYRSRLSGSVAVAPAVTP